MKPTTPGYADWLALSLVRDGWITQYRGAYRDGGGPLPRFLSPELIDTLLSEGLLRMPRPDKHGLLRLSLTTTGRARHAQLCRQQDC